GEDAPVVAEAMAIARAAAVPVIELPPSAEVQAPELEAPEHDHDHAHEHAHDDLIVLEADPLLEADGDPFARLPIDDLDVSVPEREALVVDDAEPEAVAEPEEAPVEPEAVAEPAFEPIAEPAFEAIAEPDAEPEAIAEPGDAHPEPPAAPAVRRRASGLPSL